jgi:hypothetical protein
VNNLTDTLMERVEKLLPPGELPLEWGNPRLSTTPISMAIESLARRTEALEAAVREIALEVQTSKAPLEWESPRVSTSPTSVAIQEIAVRIEALEVAVRDIALGVQKASDQGLSREQE